MFRDCNFAILRPSVVLLEMDGVVPSCIPTKDKTAKWYFSKEKLGRTPSILTGGFDKDKELRYRQQAAGFIQEMGEKLNHSVKDSRARM